MIHRRYLYINNLNRFGTNILWYYIVTLKYCHQFVFHLQRIIQHKKILLDFLNKTPRN